MTPAISFLLVLALFASVYLYGKWRTLRRAEFIRTFRWPRGLLERLEKHHPGFQRKDSALVSRGLRQFFLAYLMSGKRYVSMALASRRRSVARIHPVHARIRRVLPARVRRIPPPRARRRPQRAPQEQ